MLAQSHARKPAPPLAARGMWLRLHGGPDAFGSALGDAVVGSIAKGDEQQAPKKTFAQDVADRKAALNPYGWSTAPSAAAAPSDDRVAAFMAYGMSRSEAIERINSGEIMTDMGPQGGVRPVGQNGEPTAQLIFNPALTGGAVGGGYKPANLDSIRGTPGYDPRTDMPTNAPGYGQVDPVLGLGAPSKPSDIPWWADRNLEGIPLPIRVFGAALDNLIFKRPSDILAGNLEEAGYNRPADSAAHHIVPEGDKRAADLRGQLKDLGVGINSADNGVFLPQKPGSTAPGAYHPSLNNDDYYRQLNRDFANVTTQSDALDTLSKIRDQLLKGTYPGSRPVPPKK